MTVAVGSGAVLNAAGWRNWATRAVAAAVVTTVAGLIAPAPIAADETIRFDDAGQAPHISVLGDSTLAGVRWYSDYGSLRRFNFVFNAESCRRTIELSCVSREGYRSASVITTMRNLDDELGEVLVVMSGYNDPIGTIDEAIAAVVAEAREQGVDHVLWLSLRTSQDVDYSDPQHQSNINTFQEYNEQLVEVAAASDGYLQVADWATYSTGSSSWFESDGVHLTGAGVDAVTTFIADSVTQIVDGEDVTPAVAPWSVLVPGAEGDKVRAVQQALTAVGINIPGGADGIYGNDTMIAVAAYQRSNPQLRETGAVDIATATALGVHVDPDTAPEPTVTATSPPFAPAAAPPTTGATAPITAPAAAAADGPSGWVLAAAGAGGLGVLVASMVAVRRRHVVARRAERRWARAHPSTSPGRSVADLRRSGALPAAPSPRRLVYDHEREELPAIADTGDPIIGAGVGSDAGRASPVSRSAFAPDPSIGATPAHPLSRR